MRNNGFTLIELLGVIIILSLLMIIVFPSIINSVKNSSDKTDDLTLKLIYNATDMYISNHTTLFSKTEGKKFSIDLKDLVDEDYLVSPIKLSDSDEDITNSKCVQIVYNNGYKYELKNKGECEKICMPVTTATVGNVPKNDGTYRAGDEYICEVASNIKHRFFVLTTTTNPKEVNMIMYSNINKLGQPVDNNSVEDKGLVAWINKEDYLAAGGIEEDWKEDGNTNKGPLTALKYLQQATQNWKNMKILSINEFDYWDIETIPLYKIYNSYARLPKHGEIDCLYIEDGSCPGWMTSNLDDENGSLPYGYWTAVKYNAIDVWDVDYAGSDTNYEDNSNTSTTYGVRPVITVPVSDIG